MKRLTGFAVAAIAAGALTFAPSAGAGEADTTVAKQRGGNDLSISFVVRYRLDNGEPTKVKEFKFKKLTTTCDGPVLLDLKGKIGTMKVNKDREFKGNVKFSGGKVVVKGTTKKFGASSKGTIKGVGNFGPNTNCNTGKVAWKTN